MSTPTVFDSTAVVNPRGVRAQALLARPGTIALGRERSTGRRLVFVQSSRGDRWYAVSRDGCQCPDFRIRGRDCKHLLAARAWCATQRQRRAA